MIGADICNLYINFSYLWDNSVLYFLRYLKNFVLPMGLGTHKTLIRKDILHVLQKLFLPLGVLYGEEVNSLHGI